MYRIKLFFLAPIAALCLAANQYAFGLSAPAAHAPIGVMGDHTHAAGDWMFSYRFSHMEMRDNRIGGSDISAEAIVLTQPNQITPPPPVNLRVVPTKMSMQMHMLGAMYALNDRWTLMSMLHYMEKDMDHLTFDMSDTFLGGFRTRSRGMGDSELLALGEIFAKKDAKLMFNLGVSIPTGKTNAKDSVLAPTGATPTLRLPYPMQLGSGTYDLIGGLTFTEDRTNWNWGSQWRSKTRLDENDEDYTLGDEHQLQAWASFKQSHRLSFSARLAYFHRENIDGMDKLIRAPVQTADPGRQAARRFDAGLGINATLPGHRHRLAMEVVAPLYQQLDGPQLKNDWQLTVGWQFSP